MTVKEKRERLYLVGRELEKLYPQAECALQYGGDGWKLLVMGRLSAQCTDERVNKVSLRLFAKYPSAEAMANADISELYEIVKPCGLYRMKGDSIKAASAIIVEKYGGRIPDTMEELLSLPGVGRKIANMLLGDLYRQPCIVADTHCIRIMGRLGMYPESEKDPTKVESVLKKLIWDPYEGSDLCHRIVLFGREYCTARSPRCDECPLFGLCEKKAKEKARGK